MVEEKEKELTRNTEFFKLLELNRGRTCLKNRMRSKNSFKPPQKLFTRSMIRSVHSTDGVYKSFPLNKQTFQKHFHNSQSLSRQKKYHKIIFKFKNEEKMVVKRGKLWELTPRRVSAVSRRN